MTKLSHDELSQLKQYVTDPYSNVFAVYPNLSGIVGAVFARYSRSRDGFKEIFWREFIREGVTDQRRAADLVERVLNQFGDDSVGELEGAWLCFEDVSNLATKAIEDHRIGGSPIEKSSRYVFYDDLDEHGNFRYLLVPEIISGRLAGTFVADMDRIFTIYRELIPRLSEYFTRLKPKEEAEYDILGNGKKIKLADTDRLSDNVRFRFLKAWENDIRSKTCDTLRILLPACTLTNMGIFANGRFFQNLLSSLWEQRLLEMNFLGDLAKKALDQVIPVYVKRAAPNQRKVEAWRRVGEYAQQLLKNYPPERQSPRLELMSGDSDPGQELWWQTLAMILYPHTEHSLAQLVEIVVGMSDQEQDNLFQLYVGDRTGRRDKPGRALEAGYPFVFDCVADFGIFRDLHRERMKTQQRQFLTTRLGRVEMPPEFVAIGAQNYFEEAFAASEALYEAVRAAHGPEVAQYCTLFGHNVRWYQGENLREEVYEDELRTIAQGHPSYRSFCQEKYRLIVERFPRLAPAFQFVDEGEYFWSRAESEAKQAARELKG